MSDLAPFLQTLRERLTLSEVIRPHVRLARKGREHTGLCPFHKEKTPSFTVSDEKGFYHCFGCGAHGDIFDFVMQKQNMPFIEVVELLASLLGLEVPKRKVESSPNMPQSQPETSLYEVMEAACRWYQQQLSLTNGATARTYFEGRGLLPETIERFRLGYAPERGLQEALQKQGYSFEIMKKAGLIGQSEENESTYDRFRSRLMFPICDGKNRIIAFGGRILKEGEPKYLNSPDTPLFIKGKTLYAYNIALPTLRQSEDKDASFIVVEGYMDVIAMHQNGLKAAVAPLGTALTPEQMMLLWRGTNEPILCFDGDAAGKRAAWRAAQRVLSILRVGQTLRFCFLPEGEDPDSLLRSGRINELRQVFRNPQPLVNVLWSIFIQDRLLSTPEQKAMARRDLGHLMQEIADPDVRHFYREELNNRLQDVFDVKKRDSDRLRLKFEQKKSFSTSKSPFSGDSAAAALSLYRPIPNKNRLGYKILLATLINHPTLIEDTAESLIGFEDSLNEYEELRQVLLSIVAEKPTILALELRTILQQKGFAPILEELLTTQLYFHAPFAKETSTHEEALAGLKEVWSSTIDKSRLDEEESMVATAVARSFDGSDWEKLKYLKNQRFKKDEK